MTFDSGVWLAQADAGEQFGDAFAEERGNRLHWVTRVSAPKGEKINIEDGISVEIEPNAFRPDGVDRTIASFAQVEQPDEPKLLVAGVNDGEIVNARDCNNVEEGFVVVGTDCPDVDEIVALVPALANQTDPDSEAPTQEKVNAVYNEIANLKNGAITFKTKASFADGKPTRRTFVLSGDARGKGVTGVQPQENDVFTE